MATPDVFDVERLRAFVHQNCGVELKATLDNLISEQRRDSAELRLLRALLSEIKDKVNNAR